MAYVKCPGAGSSNRPGVWYLPPRAALIDQRLLLSLNSHLPAACAARGKAHSAEHFSPSLDNIRRFERRASPRRLSVDA